jgi:hypothetical protein
MAQIKQLCCLGLGREAIAPALTRLLLRLIPGFSVSLFFMDENCALINIYDENPALTEVAPLYVSEFYNSRETETWIELADAFRRGLVEDDTRPDSQGRPADLAAQRHVQPDHPPARL